MKSRLFWTTSLFTAAFLAFTILSFTAFAAEPTPTRVQVTPVPPTAAAPGASRSPGELKKFKLVDLDAKPKTFRPNQRIDFQLAYVCNLGTSDSVRWCKSEDKAAVDVEIWHRPDIGEPELIARVHDVTLETGITTHDGAYTRTHRIQINSNGFRSQAGSFIVKVQRGQSEISKMWRVRPLLWEIGDSRDHRN